MVNDLMTVPEVAEYLRIAEKTVYKLLLEGVIPGSKLGGSWRISRERLDKWISRQTFKGQT